MFEELARAAFARFLAQEESQGRNWGSLDDYSFHFAVVSFHIGNWIVERNDGEQIWECGPFLGHVPGSSFSPLWINPYHARQLLISEIGNSPAIWRADWRSRPILSGQWDFKVVDGETVTYYHVSRCWVTVVERTW